MKFIAIGDSITHGQYTNNGESSPLSLATPYCDIIAKNINADEYINYGMNGCSFSATSSINSEYAFEKMVDTYESADLIIIAGGTNDFGTNVKLKDFEEAVIKVFDSLVNKNPQAKIVIITPLKRKDDDKNALGISLLNYSKILKINGKSHGFLVIDGELFFIDPHNEEDRNSYMFDGVHLNDAAHKLLADYIIKKGHLLDKKYTYLFNGHEAQVIIPANFNGNWIWKTEFFYAFDKLEQSLLEDGFARVYYQISDMYGCPDSIMLMHKFYLDLIKRFPLNKKCYLVGFSRGGLYAFNFALKYHKLVKKMYLDAPVLDLRTWPRKEDSYEHELYLQVLNEYHFKNIDDYVNYKKYPVHQFKKYFSYKIPTLLVAGKGDTTVDFYKNSQLLINYIDNNKIKNAYYFVKVGNAIEGGDHHPHSFGNVDMKLIYNCISPKEVNIYSNTISGTNPSSTKRIVSDENILKFFFE